MTEIQDTKLVYSIIDRSAMTIVTLIKISNLNYIIEESHEDAGWPHVLKTPQGQLYKQYEIIAYIVAQSKRISQLQQKDQQQKINDHDSNPSRKNSSEIELQNVMEQQNNKKTVINLAGEDVFMTVKMQQKLYELRQNLFPLLHEFYKYLTGFQKTKKGKYDSLMSKIKKQIGKLDADINQHPEIYHRQFNFLNIIIACQIFMAYKFVFQEKFRKSKYSLLNKYEKISHRKQFIEVHGKSDLCLKQYVPSQFEEQNIQEKQKKSTQVVKPSDNQILKMTSKLISQTTIGQQLSARNQLLYNYFKHNFSQFELDHTQQSKKNKYYPYFWMMFDELNCSLVEIVMGCKQQYQQQSNIIRLKQLHTKIINELNTEIDYGMLGLYEKDVSVIQKQSSDKKLPKQKQQSDNKPQIKNRPQMQYIIRGVICLGSKNYEDFMNLLTQKLTTIQPQSNNHNKHQYMQQINPIKITKIDAYSPNQRKQVETLWQNRFVRKIKSQNTANQQRQSDQNQRQKNIRLCMIMNF